MCHRSTNRGAAVSGRILGDLDFDRVNVGGAADDFVGGDPNFPEVLCHLVVVTLQGGDALVKALGILNHFRHLYLDDSRLFLHPDILQDGPHRVQSSPEGRG